MIDKATGRFLVNDLTGCRFGRLLVLGVSHRGNRNRVFWNCICDCGKTKQLRADYLVSRDKLSCGCWAREIHQVSRTPTGTSWFAMMSRCFNPNATDYPQYGGRGRTVCSGLRKSPTRLIELIGERPEGKSIDRTNNRGNYTCGECWQCLLNDWPFNIRWATRSEQARNR